MTAVTPDATVTPAGVAAGVPVDVADPVTLADVVDRSELSEDTVKARRRRDKERGDPWPVRWTTARGTPTYHWPDIAERLGPRRAGPRPRP